MSSPSIATSRGLDGRRLNHQRISAAVRNERGFSILELTIVVGLILIATTIALLMAENVTRSVRLQTTAANYANLLQQARIRAVQDDKYYTVVTGTNTTTCGGAVTYCAFIDIAGTGVYDPKDPFLAFATDVKPVAYGSAPDKASLEAQFLPSASLWGTTGNTTYGPTFGPRGIPCAPTPNGSYTTCPFTNPTSYMAFMKNTRSVNYEAITVSPAGRIRLWSHDPSGTWSPLN